MDVAIFSAKLFEKTVFDQINRDFGHQLHYFDTRLTEKTSVLAKSMPAVCAFVTDTLDRPTLKSLASQGCRMIALRSAGYNHINLDAAQEFGLTVARVPAYSPHAIAEHTIGLMLCLNRKIHKAYNRVREGNFSLEGLIGFDIHQRTVGIVGTGNIGAIVARIMLSFGCQVIAFDLLPRKDLQDLGVKYGSLPELFRSAEIISLHCPLNSQTRHIINADSLRLMRDQVMILNTGRGALIDTKAAIAALKSGKIGSLGLDVYEEEEALFFEDFSDRVIGDDVFARLLTFPNVLITGHQAFLTEEALRGIATTTLDNIRQFEKGLPLLHAVRAPLFKG